MFPSDDESKVKIQNFDLPPGVDGKLSNCSSDNCLRWDFPYFFSLSFSVVCAGQKVNVE